MALEAIFLLDPCPANQGQPGLTMLGSNEALQCSLGSVCSASASSQLLVS